MHRTSNTFLVLQATAAVVAMAILLWSLGLSSIRFAEAANVTSFSDTLSTSEPSVAADHSLQFTTLAGVTNSQTITINFKGNFTGTSSITASDITVATTSNFTVAANCGGTDQIGAAFGANNSILTLTFCTGDGGSIPANGTTTITIGGTNQLVNPAAGSYEIDLTAGTTETGSTRVAIVDTVTVTASVDTLFQFSVAGVASGQNVNGTTTGTSTSATEIAFGQLVAGTPRTGAQDLSVTTNARNGFVVTVTADGQLVSTGNGADIDGFRNGNYDATAVPWEAPSAIVGSEETYGHWGVTSNDPTLTGSLTDEFDTGGDGQDYVSASTTPVEVFRHTGPTNGTGTGQGTTRVGYTVQISSLQEAADDYTATLTYVATPVF